MEIKKPVFVYCWLCQVLYISVHRCRCQVVRWVCVTFCAVFSFLILDVDVFKEGISCTLIFHGYRKYGYFDQAIVKDMYIFCPALSENFICQG
jgi:hypothetical protein